jgi:hypothetical protein
MATNAADINEISPPAVCGADGRYLRLSRLGVGRCATAGSVTKYRWRCEPAEMIRLACSVMMRAMPAAQRARDGPREAMGVLCLMSLKVFDWHSEVDWGRPSW